MYVPRVAQGKIVFIFAAVTKIIFIKLINHEKQIMQI